MGKLTFRPWSEFFELNAFKVPAQRDLPDRVQVNLVYYQANYIGVTLLLLLAACFWRPVFLFGLASIVGAAVYLFSVRKAPLVMGDKVLTKREILMAYGVLSLLVCLLFGGSHALLSLSMATLAVVLHSCFRQRSLKSKVNVGLSHAFGRDKSEDGPDDRPEDDPENPPRDRDRGEDPLAKLQSSAAADAQAQQRAAFRASMRAKYLKKG